MGEETENEFDGKLVLRIAQGDEPCESLLRTGLHPGP